MSKGAIPTSATVPALVIFLVSKSQILESLVFYNFLIKKC